MDGVLVSGRHAIPGAPEFIQRLRDKKRKFLILTNNPMYTPGDLAHRLQSSGLDVNPERIFTSAMATALFMQKQSAGNKVYAIGESGLTTALHNAGFILTDIEPDYVVLGDTFAYNYESIKKAVRLLVAGARFIATSPDVNGPSEGGIVPACGAMAALMEKASGVAPFFVGKPNPLMMRTALNYMDVHSENSVMIGDRMDTDILAGVMSGLETYLVLSGVTRREDVVRFPYR
ncbi:HAD family hydrolase, partial [bacterium]